MAFGSDNTGTAAADTTERRRGAAGCGGIAMVADVFMVCNSRLRASAMASGEAVGGREGGDN